MLLSQQAQDDRTLSADLLCSSSFRCHFDRRILTLRAMQVLLLALVMPTTGTVARAADGEEPTVRGKRAAEWLEMLQKDPKVERRRAALIALGILGPKVPGVVLGVSD